MGLPRWGKAAEACAEGWEAALLSDPLLRKRKLWLT